MKKSARFMICGTCAEAPGADPRAASLAAVLESLAVEECRDGREARRRVREGQLNGVWVAACEDVEPINLAAACKGDCPQAAVYLVTADRTGSVASRAQAADLDGVVHPAALADHMLRAARELGGDEKQVPEGRGSTDALGLPAPKQEETEGKVAAEEELASPRAGFLLAVVSGSGGAGKSTVAALAALLGARRGLRTALLDADLQFGDLAALVGDVPTVGAEDLSQMPTVPDELRASPLVLVSAPRALERSEAVAGALGAIVDRLTASFDLVVANTGGSWGDGHLLLLERAAASLFLVDQRASSVRACRHALDLCLRCGVATGSFLIAVNRCSRHAPFTSIDVSSALDGAHVTELADGGREVEELLGAGLASGLLESSNPLCASLEGVLDELLPSAPRSSGATVQAPLARIGLRSKSTESQRVRQRKRKGRAGRRESALAGELA